MNGMDKKDEEKRDLAYHMGWLTAFLVHACILCVLVAITLRLVKWILGI